VLPATATTFPALATGSAAVLYAQTQGSSALRQPQQLAKPLPSGNCSRAEVAWNQDDD